MKTFWGFLFLLLATFAAAQDAPQILQVPEGTPLAAELSKTIDAHKAKTGDPVIAKTTQDMLANGKVVIPHDSKITGHVTQVQGRPKGQKGEADSMIGIAFDQLEIKGRSMPFRASIQAIAKPLIINPAAVQAGDPSGGYGANPGMGTTPGRPGATPNPQQAPDAETQGAPPPGAISVQNTGVVGMKGFELTNNDQGSVISSRTDNVKLESGMQLILKSK